MPHQGFGFHRHGPLRLADDFPQATLHLHDAMGRLQRLVLLRDGTGLVVRNHSTFPDWPQAATCWISAGNGGAGWQWCADGFMGLHGMVRDELFAMRKLIDGKVKASKPV